MKTVSDLIETRLGLAAHTQFTADLPALLEKVSGGDVEAYAARLHDAPENAPEWQALIAELTIGETYFMRERNHFALLRNHILPPLIAVRRDRGERHLNLWSVGCATGEEPYSLAIMLYEMLPDLDTWTIRLMGTDLNDTALKAARRGIYRKWSFRHTDIDFQNTYFDPAPNGLLIKPHIRELVTFRRANLLKGAPLPQVDVILCRNVLLYFSHQYACTAETLFYDALDPGGWLILGPAETLRHSRDRWLMHLFPGTPVYQKPAQALPVREGTVPVKQHDRIDRQQTPAKRATTLTEAINAIRRKEYAQAAALLLDLVANRPGSAEIHTLLGYVHASRHRINDAHAQIDTALSLDPLLADAHYLRAMLYLEEGATTHAEKSLRATLYCQRNHPLASFMLGNLYAQSGEFTRAQRHWHNAQHAVSTLQPESPISDISDLTAGRLHTLIQEQLAGWEG